VTNKSNEHTGYVTTTAGMVNGI